MKGGLAHITLILTCLGPSPLLAQQLENWLDNVKREVSRLAINERGYLHSVNRLRNSVVQDQSLFFVSSMRFEELDIQLFSDGSVRVRKGLDGPKSNDEGAGGAREGLSDSCGSNHGKIPRLSLANSRVTESLRLSRVSQAKLNALAFVDRYLTDLILAEPNIAISPFFDGQSRYHNLLRGSHFEESKHKVFYSLEYIEQSDRLRGLGLSSTGVFNTDLKLGPHYFFSRRPKRNLLKISLMILDDNVARKETTLVYPLLDNDLKSIVEGAKSENAATFLQKMASEVKSFVLSAHCVVTHSNHVVASKGKLLLESGRDAGLRVGDELLILPKSKYFKDRGLLAGVDQIAIVRITEISALSSVLELKEGSIALEEGTEYFARPLLELI